jgi:hypothetical protein
MILGGAGAWLLALAAMVWLTANPQVVSRDQLKHADLVIIGRLVAPGQDRVRVERAIAGEIPVDTEITVLNLAAVAGIKPDQSYLLPLTFFRRDYRVTTLEGQQAAPLVYPATPEAIAVAKSTTR